MGFSKRLVPILTGALTFILALGTVSTASASAVVVTGTNGNVMPSGDYMNLSNLTNYSCTLVVVPSFVREEDTTPTLDIETYTVYDAISHAVLGSVPENWYQYNNGFPYQGNSGAYVNITNPISAANPLGLITVTATLSNNANSNTSFASTVTNYPTGFGCANGLPPPPPPAVPHVPANFIQRQLSCTTKLYWAAQPNAGVNTDDRVTAGSIWYVSPTAVKGTDGNQWTAIYVGSFDLVYIPTSCAFQQQVVQNAAPPVVSSGYSFRSGANR